jgi:hypothetical protein
MTSTLAQLNTFSSGNVTFTADTIALDRTVGSSFLAPICTWEAARQLGNLTGNGVQVVYEHQFGANVVVTFPSSGQSMNPLTITSGPSSLVKTISGMKTIVDWNASLATVTPPVGDTGNVVLKVTVTNTNSAAGDFVLSVIGVPV